MNSGKVIVITGCSSGIGLDAAIRLTDRGYRVIAAVRKEVDEARLTNAGIECVLLDLLDHNSISQAINKIEAMTDGKIYALFNNAGFAVPGAVEDLPTEALRIQFEANVFGAHELTIKLLPMMLNHGSGRIIQNSSFLGFVTLQYRGAYSASKYALEALSDALRLELNATGSDLHVSIIEPGPILTMFRANALVQFDKWIDINSSRHKEKYKKLVERLECEGEAMPFTLQPEAVTKALIHALEAKCPKARYRVTFPARLFWVLRRLLPTRILDGILGKGL